MYESYLKLRDVERRRKCFVLVTGGVIRTCGTAPPLSEIVI